MCQPTSSTTTSMTPSSSISNPKLTASTTTTTATIRYYNGVRKGPASVSVGAASSGVGLSIRGGGQSSSTSSRTAQTSLTSQTSQTERQQQQQQHPNNNNHYLKSFREVLLSPSGPSRASEWVVGVDSKFKYYFVSFSRSIIMEWCGLFYGELLLYISVPWTLLADP